MKQGKHNRKQYRQAQLRYTNERKEKHGKHNQGTCTQTLLAVKVHQRTLRCMHASVLHCASALMMGFYFLARNLKEAFVLEVSDDRNLCEGTVGLRCLGIRDTHGRRIVHCIPDNTASICSCSMHSFVQNVSCSWSDRAGYYTKFNLCASSNALLLCDLCRFGIFRYLQCELCETNPKAGFVPELAHSTRLLAVGFAW